MERLHNRRVMSNLTTFYKQISSNAGVLKTQNKIWISLTEFNSYFALVLWATRSSALGSSFRILNVRIKHLVDKGSFQTTFLYLKEVLRITIKVLAKQVPEKGKVLVQCDKRHLPTIIPWKLREVILLVNFIGPLNKDQVRYNRNVIVALLTAISIFRVFPTNVKPDLKTIVSKFDGINLSLDSSLLTDSIKSILINKYGKSSFKVFRLPKINLLLLETASPNCSKSTWGSAIDAIAFIQHPKVFINFIKLNWFYGFKSLWLSLWIIIIIITYIPIFFLISLSRVIGPLLFKIKIPKTALHIAKLGVVYDQAGKARIVGISNYWVQCLLKPIHNAVFDILKALPEDGTFDQMKPLDNLLKRVPEGQTLYSFDLSAATDRLPINLQSDILNIIKPGLGPLWANLLTQMDYSYEIRRGVYKNVRYSVGQPMGAYSSWPMLALTHHIIVKCASINGSLKDFKDYAVLGDDIVIANDIVASEYIKLMHILGVSINFSKTLQSDTLCEFAKKWRSKDVDYSPIGPGVLLNAVRSRNSIPALLYKINEMKLVTDLIGNWLAIKSLPAQYRFKLKQTDWINLWVAFGLYSYNVTLSQNQIPAFARTMFWCFEAPTQISVHRIPHLMIMSLWKVRINQNTSMLKSCWEAYDFLNNNVFKLNVSRGTDNKLTEFLLKLVSPCYWVYSETIFKEMVRIYTVTWNRYATTKWHHLEMFLNEPGVNPLLVSADWKEKKIGKEEKEIAKALRKEFTLALNNEFKMLMRDFHLSNPNLASINDELLAGPPKKNSFGAPISDLIAVFPPTRPRKPKE